MRKSVVQDMLVGVAEGIRDATRVWAEMHELEPPSFVLALIFETEDDSDNTCFLVGGGPGVGPAEMVPLLKLVRDASGAAVDGKLAMHHGFPGTSGKMN